MCAKDFLDYSSKFSSLMFMSSPIQQRSNNIKATVEAYKDIIPALPGAHALSGCDTAHTYFGNGKKAVLKILVVAPDLLAHLGCLDVPLSDVIDESTKFIGACYSKGIFMKEKLCRMSDTESGRLSLGILHVQLQILKHYSIYRNFCRK